MFLSVVSFARSMSQGVKGHQDTERMAKIRERNRDERLRRYHKEILARPDHATGDVMLPPINDCVRLYTNIYHVYYKFVDCL